MSDKEHTPVEWFFCGSFVYQVDSDSNKRKVADCTSKPLNQIAIDEVLEDNANARLIAAAPAMLEELEGQQASCRCRLNYKSCVDCIARKSCSLLRVIKKARGEKDV